jgi:hypothetical protein
MFMPYSCDLCFSDGEARLEAFAASKSLHRVARALLAVRARGNHMLNKFMASLLAVLLAFGTVMAANTAPAEAGRGGRVAAGVAAGIIGLGVLGAYAHARERHYYSGYRDDDEVCYRGPRECGWVGRRCFENRYGDEVCRGGRWTCWRDTVCD